MSIVVIYGQQHKGNTWKFTELFLKGLKESTAEITEFFLPEDGPSYCTGCLNCIYVDERACPQAMKIQPIVNALDKADLIIISSAVYVLGMTGQLKTLLDHLAYRHMAHRPEPSMFRKQALVLSTAAGAGMRKAVKAISDNMLMWGVARTYGYGLRIGSPDFDHIPRKRKQKIIRRADCIIHKIKKNQNPSVGIKTRLLFSFMRLGQKHNDWNPLDKEYWHEKGWMEKRRPF